MLDYRPFFLGMATWQSERFRRRACVSAPYVLASKPDARYHRFRTGRPRSVYVCRGNGNRQIASAAALDDPLTPAPTISRLSQLPNTSEAGLSSNAGCFIAPADFPTAGDRTIIESAQPRAHFAQALALLYPVGTPSFRHPSHGRYPPIRLQWTRPRKSVPSLRSAVTRKSARAPASGAAAAIGSDSVVGADSLVHARVTIYGRVHIGARALGHAGAVLGADGFGFEREGAAYRKVPQVGRVEIGDDVEIGANCCIDRATLGATVIGDGTKLDNLVHIGHNCKIGRHVLIVAQTGLAGGVTVGDYAVIGGQVGVGDKARIESKAVIGSGAGILSSKIVRAGEPVWGTPARPLRQYLRQLATLSRLAKGRRA